jgi:crossover junction endodeoxyribonuclease RuvC
MTSTLGCDPGLYGAVALWDDALDALVIRDAPIARIAVGKSKNRAVLVDAEYARLVRELEPDRVVIEKVGGLTGQSASASFNFGASFGLLRGFAAMLELPVYFIEPPVWRAKLRVPAGKDGSRLRASQLFPRYAELFSRAKDDGRAEAALMAVCPISSASVK